MTRVVDLFFKADDITAVMQSELLICFPKKKTKTKQHVQSISHCTENYIVAKIIYPKISSG